VGRPVRVLLDELEKPLAKTSALDDLQEKSPQRSNRETAPGRLTRNGRCDGARPRETIGALETTEEPTHAGDVARRAGEEGRSMSRERWMALFFAIGSACFFVGPFPGYARLVGGTAVAVTFFVGSLLFTAGGALQTWLAAPDRRSPGTGPAMWWAAVVQSAGTVFFNVTTYQGLHTATSNAAYDRLVWRPDALGSVCFLVSGVIAYRAAPRNGWRPARDRPGWWEPSINLLGCVFFGISAVAGYLVPSSGSILDLAAANWNTAAGAACFLACALATLATGRTVKSRRFRRIRALEDAVERDIGWTG
jgi:hypothetical protein